MAQCWKCGWVKIPVTFWVRNRSYSGEVCACQSLHDLYAAAATPRYPFDYLRSAPKEETKP